MEISNFEVTFFKNEQEMYKKEYKNDSKEKNVIQFECFEYDTIINLEDESFTRENDDFLFFLDIKNKYCTIQLKKEKLDFDIHVDECILHKENNKIILEYTIETEDAKNKLVIKDLERKFL